MIFTVAFANTANAVPQVPQPSTVSMLLPFALMFVVFYFLLIRPQQKKVKDHENMVKGLQKGEEVITQSGIIGRIHGLTDKVVTLEVDNNVKIKILKSQVASVIKADQPLA